MKTRLLLATAAILSLPLQQSHARSNAYSSHDLGPDVLLVDAGTSQNLGFTFDLGFDSQYNFNGIRYGDQLLWSHLDYEISITDSWFLGFGLWYGDITGEKFDDFSRELDFSVALTREFSSGAALSLVYTHYTFFGDIPSEPELGIEIAKSIGWLDLSLWYSYDFEEQGHYLEARVGSEIVINDWLSIIPSAELAYISGYNVEENGFNHAAVRIDFPIDLNDHIRITPFVAAVFPIDALKAGGLDENEIHGGIMMQIQF